LPWFGFNLNGAAVRRGGRPAAIVLAVFTAGAFLQNGVGVALARWQGLHPLIGIATGAVAFAGGPATSLAFGPTLEEAGARGATSVALACAITGILAAGLLTGAFGGLLVQRYRLLPPKDVLREERGSMEPVPVPATAELLSTTLLFGVAMGLGAFVNVALRHGLGVSLPAYVGAMIVAAGIRSAASRWPLLRVPPAAQLHRLHPQPQEAQRGHRTGPPECASGALGQCLISGGMQEVVFRFRQGEIHRE
jgi:glutamate:Na+ symporter, ESS family